MALPTTRQQFKDYCLRKLGAPVIQINVDEDQVNDRIDEAILFYTDWGMDALEKVYYKYQVQAQDKVNQYITLPDNIIGAVDIFPIGESLGSNNLFNIRYQIALNDLYTLTSVSMVPYVMAMQNIQFLEEILVGKQPLRYNRHVNNLYIDMDWNMVNVGDYIVVVAYQVIDPDVYPKMWGDRWLLKYATALIGEQWCQNLSKFKDMKLPGGVSFNVSDMLAKYESEIKFLEEDMRNSSIPAYDAVG